MPKLFKNINLCYVMLIKVLFLLEVRKNGFDNDNRQPTFSHINLSFGLLFLFKAIRIVPKLSKNVNHYLCRLQFFLLAVRTNGFDNDDI